VPSPPAAELTSATVRASRIQPTTSLPTPAERTTTPTVVSSSLSSVRIRQRTGKAVIDMAVPAKGARQTRGLPRPEAARPKLTGEQQKVAKVDGRRDELVVDWNGNLSGARAGRLVSEAWREGPMARDGRTAAPRPKGRIMPASAMTVDSRALRLMTPMSTSRPTRKRNSTRPGAEEAGGSATRS
jgi:hypothetical protein